MLMHYVNIALEKSYAYARRALGKTFQGYISGRGTLQQNLPYTYLRAKHSFCDLLRQGFRG
jgi:hypothetical protein